MNIANKEYKVAMVAGTVHQKPRLREEACDDPCLTPGPSSGHKLPKCRFLLERSKCLTIVLRFFEIL